MFSTKSAATKFQEASDCVLEPLSRISSLLLQILSFDFSQYKTLLYHVLAKSAEHNVESSWFNASPDKTSRCLDRIIICNVQVITNERVLPFFLKENNSAYDFN